jgi:aminoglycoside/choline kinase family phosphotransferase
MERLEELEQWLASHYRSGSFHLTPASADASFRRYFRVHLAEGDAPSVIAMDAPPRHEDCRPFIHVAGLLLEAGLNAPRILAQDLERGFLLLSDLGSTTYLAALDASNADTLFADAVDALIRWQLASRPAELPPYDETLLRRELDLFPEWYVARHLGIALSGAQRQAIESTFRLVLTSNLAQPKVFVHRDYMPRNLMVSDPNPGILDFQDAVFGPISYDVASLFRDAFVSWPEEQVLDWTVRYWEKARRAGLPVRSDFGAFYQELEWMGLQRHLKVLGIFARLQYRDGKPDYLHDAPRFVAYVRAACERYAALAPLARLLDQLENRSPQARYTF